MEEQDFGIKIPEEQYHMELFSSSQNLNYIILHEWQRKAIAYFWEHKGNVVFEVTTGAGKTYCAIEIIKQILKEHPKYYVLIVVPKNVILEKGWFPELCNNGFSIVNVGVYYGFTKEIRQITITNMQNVTNLDMSLFDFIVLDEIHNYCTKRLFKVLEHPFKYKLGLSATIERLDAAHWKMLKTFEYNKFSYTPKEALIDNVLNKFNFINIGVTMDDINYDQYQLLTQEISFIIKQGGSYTRVMQGKSGNDLRLKLLKKLNERKQLVLNYPLKMEVMKYLCKIHKNEKTLVFNEYNKTTSACYFELLDVGIRARILHSGVTKYDRDRVLNDFRSGKFNTLLATKILDEGYNLPAISVAIIQAGNSTARQTIQRLGRVLRKKEEISTLYQIFVSNTMEEQNSKKRAILFKELCSDFKEYRYDEKDGLILI